MGIEITSSTKWPAMDADEVRENKSRLSAEILGKLESMADWAMVNFDLVPLDSPLRKQDNDPRKTDNNYPDFDWMESESTGLEVLAVMDAGCWRKGVVVVPPWLLFGGKVGGASFDKRWTMAFDNFTWRVETSKGPEGEKRDAAADEDEKRLSTEVYRALVGRCSLRRLEEFNAFLDYAQFKLRNEVLGAAIGEGDSTGVAFPEMATEAKAAATYSVLGGKSLQHGMSM